MIVGIGVDTESIARFENIDDSFINRVFTKEEIEYCNSKKNPSEHFAARFSAKEAVKKALSPVDIKLDFNEISIEKINDYPSVAFKDKTLNSKYNVYLSMSHSKDQAIAFVIIQDK